MANQSNSLSADPSFSDFDERIYLLRRADDHRRMAARADEAGAKALHLRFERLYRQRVDGADIVQSD